MGKVIMSGIVPLLSVPVTTKPNFADNTWAQIIKACQANRVPDTWAVGNQKTMTIGGTDYVIDIIGKNHDTYSSGGTAPLTFQLHDCYGIQYTMNSSNTNVGGWTSCQMRTTNLPDILAAMPGEVQSGIKEVNKATSAGDRSSTINITADKLFLLSMWEVTGNTGNYSFPGEGTQYAYYQTSNNKIKKYNNSAAQWLLRSPYNNGSTRFCIIDFEGDPDYYIASGTSNVSFAFCF